MAFATEIRSINAGIFDRISAFAHDVAARRAQYRVYRQTVNELSALSERDLADLGLHRSMIATVSHTAAYGE